MAESAPLERSAATEQAPSRYRVHLLPDARATQRGIVYRQRGRRYLLAWTRVQRVFAAEVGEPEGVRTIVFDLAVEVKGKECVVCRCDAEPGDQASDLARAIQLGIGRDRCPPSIRAVADDGYPTRWYPDLESFEEAAFQSIGLG